MYSKIKIAGHPVHPMLVGIPVTLYLASLGCFAAHSLGAPALWFQIGVYANVAGVIGALVAAVPGFIDWAYGVPLGTNAKSTGFVHMVLNVAALLVFALNVLLQWSHRLDSFPATGLSVVLPAIGVVLTLAAGFRGWTLVQKHHVGVDLSPDQERFEPHPNPEAEHRGSAPHTSHRQASR
jgi:uncharacterized membrane protein